MRNHVYCDWVLATLTAISPSFEIHTKICSNTSSILLAELRFFLVMLTFPKCHLSRFFKIFGWHQGYYLVSIFATVVAVRGWSLRTHFTGLGGGIAAAPVPASALLFLIDLKFLHSLNSFLTQKWRVLPAPGDLGTDPHIFGALGTVPRYRYFSPFGGGRQRSLRAQKRPRPLNQWNWSIFEDAPRMARFSNKTPLRGHFSLFLPRFFHFTYM